MVFGSYGIIGFRVSEAAEALCKDLWGCVGAMRCNVAAPLGGIYSNMCNRLKDI